MIDIDHNGVINAADARLILRVAFKLDTFGHSYTFNTERIIAPTCTMPGTLRSFCKCGTYIDSVLPVTAHTVVTDKAVAATCAKTGLTWGTHCEICKEVIIAQTVVNKLPDTEVTDIAIVPYCGGTGLTEGSHCSVCGEVIVPQVFLEKLPHTVVTDEAVAPTCSAEGLTKGSHCSVCREVMVAQQSVEKLPHTEVTVPAITATCALAGRTEGIQCLVCGVFIKKPIEIAKPPHNKVNDPEIPATCTEPGTTSGVHCSECGQVFVARNKISPTGHYANKWVYSYDENIYKSTCKICSENITTNGSAGLDFEPSQDGTAYYISGDGDGRLTDSRVLISITYKSLPVIGILGEAFKNNKDIIGLVVPKNVTSIGKRAFYDCERLDSVYYNVIEKFEVPPDYIEKQVPSLTTRKGVPLQIEVQ